MNLQDLSLKLKHQNPVKFLELIPELVTGIFLEKMRPCSGTFEHLLDNKKKIIDNNLKSEYNFPKICLGGIIFIVGSYLANELSKNKNKKEENHGKSISI